MIVVTLFSFIALGCYGWRIKCPWMVITFGALPSALVFYFLLGISLARAMGQGRFFSVPFGGYSVSGNEVLVASVVFWLIVWMGILYVITRKFKTI